MSADFSVPLRYILNFYNMRNYLLNREKAIAWINSRNHDFSQGLSILKEAGFKPGVVGVLERHGSGRHQSDERLMYHMRDFIKCYANDAAREDTDLELGVVEGKNIQPEEKVKHNGITIPSMFSDETEERLKTDFYPEPVAKIIKRYRDAFVERDRLRIAMADLPEINDEETVEKRHAISDRAKVLADEMDKLYPLYENYVVSGKLPDEETTGKSNVKSDAPKNKAELQKERKSVATKILRARNMLLYQTETKQDQENPMTDQKKVVKYQTKIDKLSELLNTIDMQLAALT